MKGGLRRARLRAEARRRLRTRNYIDDLNSVITVSLIAGVVGAFVAGLDGALIFAGASLSLGALKVI